MKNSLLSGSVFRKTIQFFRFMGFLALLLGFSVHGYSQTTAERTVTANLKNVALSTVISQIEKQTDFLFVYDEQVVDVKRKVSLDANNSKVSDVLKQVLTGTNVVYTVQGKNIVLKEENSAKDQKIRKITGVVTDDTGIPIIGASIVDKSTKEGTITDVNGNFTIMASSKSLIAFSYIGYTTVNLTVGDKKNMDVRLIEDTKILDEVVVVGYGTQKKVNMTGAVSTLSAKLIADRPSNSIAKSIQGSVAGVTVISRPGGTSLNIRGRGNLGSSDPLYIVDGVEVSSGYFNSLDPTSIENLSFLKDASSAAIYGAKAAFGVILVTTKSAKAGQLQVTYNGSYGSQRPTYLPKILNSAAYADMYRTAERNSGVKEANLTFNDNAIAKYLDGSDLDRYPNTNWFDLVLNDQSLFTKHNMQFAGGSEKVKYVLGLGYLRNETLTPGEGTDRYNFSSKTSADLKSWLTISSNVNFIYDKYKRDKGAANLLEFLRVPPTQTAKQLNGNWGSIRNGRQTTAEETNYNPLRNFEESGRSNSDNKRFLGSIAAELRPIKDLKITNQLAYNYSDYRGFTFQNRKLGVPSFLNPNTGIIPGTASGVNQMDMNWNYSEKLVYDGWANYDHTFNNVHAFTVVAGVHADSYLYKLLTVGRKDFASNEMNAISGGSTDPKNQLITNSAGNDYIEESMNSYFGRIGYVYNQKYMFEANFRADASSRFAKGGRWGYFPSLSAGWRVDQEKFMKNMTWVDGLKVRGSWGLNGNINNVGSYDTYSTFSASNTAIMGGLTVPTLVEGRLGNDNLTWETTTTTDLGLDLSIKNGLLGLTFDYYNRLTSDILIRANDVMSETGLSPDQIPARNVGSICNKGIELSLTHKNKIGEISYGLGFNTSINNNEIIDLGDKVDQLPPSSYWILRKGGSIGDFYMLEADGLYSTDDVDGGKVIPYGAQKITAGMVKYVDQLTIDTDGDGIFDKADGVIDDKDRVVVGNDVPKFTYGVNMEVSYKNFTLSAMGQGVSNVKVYMDSEASQAFFDNSVPREWQTDNWTPDNQNAAFPKLFIPTNTSFKYNGKTSSYWLFDASYFRIKNVTLNYTIPSAVSKLAKLENVRVYISGDNLFTFRGDNRMKDFDPEAATGRGYQIGMKTFTAGLSVTF